MLGYHDRYLPHAFKDLLMKSLLSLFIAVVCCPALIAQDDKPLNGWVYPDAQAKQQVSAPLTVTSADKTSVQTATTGLGQYVTEDEFHAVVKYYVNKSGLVPPNWSILGRKFPGDTVHLPAHFNSSNSYREKPSVSIAHYIREHAASCQLLITDFPDVGFMSISITRGKGDAKTLIQIIQHPAKKIERGR